MTYKTILTYAVSVLLAFSIAMGIFSMVDKIYEISRHPTMFVFTVLIYFCLIIFIYITKEKMNFVYLLIFTFPFLRVTFRNVSLFYILPFIILVFYYRDVIAYIKNTREPYKEPFLILLVSIVISTTFAKYKIVAAEQTFYIIALVLIYLLLSVFVKTRNDLNKFYFSWCLVLFLCIFVSFYQFFFGVDSIKLFFGSYGSNVLMDNLQKRIPSIFWEAQLAGMYFATILFIAFGLGVYFKKMRIFLKLVCGFCLIAMFLTGTRIATVSCFCGIAFLFLRNFSIKKIFIFFIGVAIILPAYFIQLPASQRKAIGRFDYNNILDSYDFRYRLWLNSIDIIFKNPMGAGLGGENVYNASVASKVYILPVFDSNKENRRHFHFESTYLDILYSLGFFGLFGFLVLIYRYFKLWHSLLASKNSQDKEFSMYMVTSMVVWLACVVVSPRLYDIQSMFIFMLLLFMMTKTKQLCESGVNNRLS